VAKLSASERGRLIWKLADLRGKNIDEFAELETLDNGKPIFESRYVDMPMVVDVLRYYAGLATKIHGDTVNTSETAFTYTLREPVGVVGMIVPWNFPLLLASWKLGPALACGNTVVWKPASQTSLTTLRFGKLAVEAGVPAGVINIVTGPGAVGRAMVKHPGIDKIAFTGLTVVGGLTGSPQVSIPGAEVDGLPLGLSIVGARGGDATLIAIALALAGRPQLLVLDEFASALHGGEQGCFREPRRRLCLAINDLHITC